MSTRHTISVFTEDSPGVLHRITDLFTRRKINIDSLTVSATEQPGVARFTIVVTADRTILEKITRQIERVIEVRDAFLFEDSELLYKEIAFLKVETAGGEKRIELEELIHRYGGSVMYAETGFLVLEKTGTEDEINSLYTLVEPYGILEFIRSGRIAMLKRRIERDLPAMPKMTGSVDPRGEM